jgi:hypothetical protein
MDWVAAVGFQKEALHTAALRHLLSGPNAVTVARTLTGDERIDSVTAARSEARLTDGRRPVDLAAQITADGESGLLGVEVKVDSPWSATQLRETVPPRGHGVLLAVGRTRLAVTEDDMRHLDADYQRPWRCVGPGEFAGVVEQHAVGDPELISYARHLRDEEEEHLAARAAVRGGSRVHSRRDATALAHWAYFGEVLGLRDDAHEWDRKTLISGPLVTRWLAEREDGSGDYLEFMGEGDRRSLCIKTYAPKGLLTASRARSRGRVDQLDGDAFVETKAPDANAKTCTVVRFELHDPPAAVTELVDRLIGVLVD